MVFRSSFVAAACSAVLFLSGSAHAGPRFVHSAPFTQSAQFTQSAPFTQAASKDELCSLVPVSYAAAKQSHPELAFAIDEVTKHSIATWYSDRNADYETVPQRLVSTCPESSRLSVVVYGLPNKDCEAGYSSTNSRVKNKADYVQFLQNLINTIENRKVLYVLEPDAVGLLAKEGGCGEAAGYRDNLKTAIQMLSRNPNAEIYLDVGYWTLAWPEPRQRVVEVIQNLLSGGGRVKGITLNTSNFRKTSEIAGLCSDFQQQMGSTEMNCIIDTSRNYRGSPSSEWCNVGSAGIGQPATSDTGISNIDYFLWIKPAGESDGSCEGGDHTADATRGPAAGEFFVDGFKKLWDYGYFVDVLKMPSFSGGGAPSPAQTPAPTPAPTSAPTQAPTPDSTSFIQTGAPQPEPTTQTPSTPAPEVTTAKPAATTPAPEVTTAKPAATTPAPEVTTAKPAATTPAPEVTTAKPAATTPAPEVTTAKPAATTPAPEVTIAKPDPTTAKPEATTPAPLSTTPMPTPTTVAPGTGATDVPSITPKTPSPSASSSSGSSSGTPTPRPSFRPTKEPKTKAPKTPSPEIETPAPNNDIVQKETPVVDAGPSTIGGNPIQATTKSGATGSSGAGAIIAAVLIVAVAMAVAAAVFIHIRRRKQDATADDMKTPVSLDPAHPAYMSQL